MRKTGYWTLDTGDGRQSQSLLSNLLERSITKVTAPHKDNVADTVAYRSKCVYSSFQIVVNIKN